MAFAKHLHDSLPNATYVGFTGTPVDATLDVFGDIVRFIHHDRISNGRDYR